MTARERDIARHVAWAVRDVRATECAGIYDRRHARAELRFWEDREALEHEPGGLEHHGAPAGPSHAGGGTRTPTARATGT